MIPRFRPALSAADLACVFTSKTDLLLFEQAFSASMGYEHSIVFPYGRTALSSLLIAMGITGKEVLCPAYTCVVVAHAIVDSGNEPVFIDSLPDSPNMDLDLASRAVTSKTAAIIPTALFGQPVDSSRLEYFTSKHPHIAIIHDRAQGFTSDDRPLAERCHHDAAIFSFGLSKLITTVFGGAVATNNADLARRLKQARSRARRPIRTATAMKRLAYLLLGVIGFRELPYSIIHHLETTGGLGRLASYYQDDLIEMPTDDHEGLLAWQIVLGMRQLRSYPDVVNARRNLARFYREGLAHVHGAELFPDAPGSTNSHFAFLVKDRLRIIKSCAAEGVQLGHVLEYSIPELPAYRSRAVNRAPCPRAARLAAGTVNMPMGVDPEQAQKALRTITSVLGETNILSTHPESKVHATK